MSGFLLRRFAGSLLLLLLVLTASFFLLRLIPGGPMNLIEDPRLNREQRENLLRVYGLDRPLPEQYARWLSAVALRGDLGISYSQRKPVADALLEVLPATALLAGSALAVEALVSLLLGVAAARSQGKRLDHILRIVSLLSYSLPGFWLGLMAILLFSYVWPILPSSHMHSVDADRMSTLGRLADLAWHLILPATILGLSNAGSTTRFVRASFLEVMSQDYIRTARAKGLSERRVVWVHGLRNALTPTIQVLAISLPALLSGSFITEVVFSWPGMGRLTFNAILTRDYPLVLGATAFAAAVVVVGNFLADVLHALSDPRVRRV
ncbi:MAG TPA: ABC transporter permease [Thermoanaerobaculia bacterium]